MVTAVNKAKPTARRSSRAERVSNRFNRKRALASLVGRIFCGEPPKSAIADLGDIECRSRVNPRSVSTFPENALARRLGVLRPQVKHRRSEPMHGRFAVIPCRRKP